MARMIQFEGRQIAVPDDATDAEIEEILLGPSAPAAAPAAPPSVTMRPDGGVDTDSFLRAVSPGWTPAAPSATPPAEPSLVDRIMGPGAQDTVDYAAGTVAQGARGFRRGVANVLGLPVDIVNAAPMVANLIPGVDGVGPISDRPIGGSKSIDQLLGAGGLIPEPPPPADMTQRMVRRVGEEIGAATVPAGAALVTAGRVGVQGARELPGLARMFVEPAAVNPARFASKEATVATAAGTGAGIANEITRSAGVDPNSATARSADMGGALVGATLPAIVGGVARGGANAVRAMVGSPDYVDDVVRERVTDELIRASGEVPKPGQEVDTANLVARIMGGERPAETIPGFRESLADRTGNPGIAALEYGRQSGPNAGAFVQRRDANARAVDATLAQSEPQGTPGAFRSELEAARDRQLTDAATATAAAQSDFDRAAQPLRSVMTGEARGADVRAALEGASDRAKDILRQAWAPIGQSDVKVPTAPLADEFGRINADLSVAERRRFLPNEASIPAELAGRTEPAAPDPMAALTGRQPAAPAAAEPQPIREITGLRSALTDASREAATAGRNNEARIINQHIDALDAYLEKNVPGDLLADYQSAKAATRDFADRFTRPQTAIAQVLDRQEGRYRQPDSAVAGKFVQSDEGRVADFEALMREAGSDTRVQTAVRDQILADVRDRGLLDAPERLTEYLGQYGTVFGKFPGLRDELGTAAKLRTALDSAKGAETSLQKIIGKDGSGTVAKYLRYGDENADRAMKAVLADKDPAKAIDELVTYVGNDPAAVEGARKVFWDIMKSKSRSGGETTKTMDGVQPWLPNRLQTFLDDPRNAAVAARLWKDNPEHIDNVRKVAAVLQNVDTRTRAKAPNTSGTAQGVSNVLTPETLQSRFYAYQRGQISGTFLVTSIVAVAARRAVGRAQTEAIGRMLDEALLNPDAAAALLRENNPANRAALARGAKGWMGNQASTLLDILTEKDETADAVMR